ncbi:Sip1-related alpha-galactosidase [Paenibacillus yanchengensis]|uniref:Sip1-related alpha-galactosidase n=1 Tax=Paenibacillus yanchengensis TaxID=2035833 RepID=A0ABW4YGP4_9BACL
MNLHKRHVRNVEPPAAHAMHSYDEHNNVLTYYYNGQPLICFQLPSGAKPYFKTYSNGNIQSTPFTQQVYLSLDQSAPVKVTFQVSAEAVNMRPHRAAQQEAIIGQIGQPLLYGVNGMYDVLQDLLLEWHGASWTWQQQQMEQDAEGNWTCTMMVAAGLQPFYINLRMQYYRKHLGFEQHQPWKWRPKLQPRTGWSTWEAFAQRVDGEAVAEAATFMNKQFKPYGMELIQIDDGFQIEPIPPTADGIIADSWLQTNEKFTNQHEGLLDSIKQHGFEAGIWTSAMVTNESFAKKHANLFEKDLSGEPLYGQWIYYTLKSEIELLQDQVSPLYRGLLDKGYSYFKTDQIRHYLFDGLHEVVKQGLITNEEATKQLRVYMQNARQALGDDAYFLACWGVLSEVVGIVDACRIAGDSNAGWPAITKQVVESARWYHTHRILFLNDPDYACMRTEPAWGKMLLSLISLSGQMLIISDNPALYDKETIHTIQRCMPAISTRTAETGPLDMTVPLDLSLPSFRYERQEGIAAAYAMLGLAPDAKELPQSSLWAFHYELPGRSWAVVGRFAVIPLPETNQPLSGLALDPEQHYYAFDFWQQQYKGVYSQSIKFEQLALGHCQVIALTAKRHHPQLIASSRHVSMDIVSVEREQWAEDARELILDISGVVGTSESYFIAAPATFQLHEYNSLGEATDPNQPIVIKLEQVQQLEQFEQVNSSSLHGDTVWKLTVTFTEARGCLRLSFAK